MIRNEIFNYRKTLVPLLQRMSNLEKLNLIFQADQCERFIDGNTLTTDILQHMTNLKQFSFNIHSQISIRDQIHLLSCNDIQRTFINFQNTQITSWTDYLMSKQIGQCIAYSHPYSLDYFNNIANHFPDGLFFQNVTSVSLHDDRSFEHEFFVRISQSFPFLKELDVTNEAPQKKKNASKFNTITYSCLTRLCVLCSHDDYLEQFLLDTKTSLPSNMSLSAACDTLETVTCHFTRSDTKSNCTKFSSVSVCLEKDKDRNRIDLSNLCHVYFPNAKIDMY